MLYFFVIVVSFVWRNTVLFSILWRPMQLKTKQILSSTYSFVLGSSILLLYYYYRNICINRPYFPYRTSGPSTNGHLGPPPTQSKLPFGGKLRVVWHPRGSLVWPTPKVKGRKVCFDCVGGSLLKPGDLWQSCEIEARIIFYDGPGSVIENSV